VSDLSKQILATVMDRRRLPYATVEAAAASLLFLLDAEVTDGGTVTVTDKTGRHKIVNLDKLFAFDAAEVTA
jgi:hypothetical protein